MHFHILSFEGPDSHARVGGLATRVEGLARALQAHADETHLWFVGDPDSPGHEKRDGVHYHRWCQWLSRARPGNLYDDEPAKVEEYGASLPPYVLGRHLLPHLLSGGRAVVLAEEWHTVGAVLSLDTLLRRAGVRDRVSLLWNANNTFGFEGIDWRRLAAAATITTVSRYMRHRMQLVWGVDALAIPNGLDADAFLPPDPVALERLRRGLRDRMAVVKMARWDPDKRWLASVRLVAELKRRGFKPLWIARGGSEPHGAEVLQAMREAGLHVVDRFARGQSVSELVEVLSDVDRVDVVSLRSHVGPEARRVLLRAGDVVLANSEHEPFGLVGLETMAVGGLACTGCTGEDYAVPGQNALVLQTAEPAEFIGLYARLESDPDHLESVRAAARQTAERFAWPEVVRRNLLPRVELARADDRGELARFATTARSRPRASRSHEGQIRGWRPAMAALGGTQ
ncbi:MAG: glycosyltransferase [Deltaproteobacteria bacterium]|nr:glycosyltransferase [Deltaproteobacteria bacterium]